VPQTLADDVRALLDRSRIGHLATADRQLRPHVVPFCYAREDDRLYFVVDEKPKQAGKRLKRLRNIAENPAVALVVDVYDEDWRRLEYALVRGTAEIVTRPEEFQRALALRFPQDPPPALYFARDTIQRLKSHYLARFAGHGPHPPSIMGSQLDVDYRHLLQLLQAYLLMIPSWLQVVLSYYLAIVLASWGRNRIAAKKRFLPAVIGFAIAGLLALRATSILMTFLSD